MPLYSENINSGEEITGTCIGKKDVYHSLFLIRIHPEYETGNRVSGSVHFRMYQYVPVARTLPLDFPSQVYVLSADLYTDVP